MTGKSLVAVGLDLLGNKFFSLINLPFNDPVARYYVLYSQYLLFGLETKSFFKLLLRINCAFCHYSCLGFSLLCE